MKVYNERETAEILKTAAQNSKRGAEGEKAGLTIDELEHIAKETGIDPAEINKAAEAMELKRQSDITSFWGGPFVFAEKVQVDHEISATEWENMLISIRELLQSKGDVSTRESVYEWNSPMLTSNSAHVTALKEKGKTKISIGWRGPMTAFPYYLPIPFIGLAYLVLGEQFLNLTPVTGLSSMALLLGLSFVTGRWALRRKMKSIFATLQKLATVLQGDPDSKEETPVVLEDQRASTPSELSKMDLNKMEPLIDLDQNDAYADGSETRTAERSKE